MKYFIDCGAHAGESVALFKRDYPNAADYKIISFEPNNSFPTTTYPDVEFHNVAVWVNDEPMTFYRHEYEVGFSLYNTHPKSLKGNSFVVQAINFSEWLSKIVTPEDYVILKMDIEGAEYKILRKMFDDGSIDLVDKLYIEFHDHWMQLAEGEHTQLVADLEAKGLHPYDWNAAHNKAYIEAPGVE